MATVRGCFFPDHLRYDVENHLWYEKLESGQVRIGMTSVALALSGEVLAFTPKRTGRRFEALKSCATIESGKWAGPARSAFPGSVVEINETLMRRPRLANLDPYGEGWMLVAALDDPAQIETLPMGNEVAESYEQWMEREKFPGCGE